MKKVHFLVMLLPLVFVACQKDDDTIEQDLIVRYWQIDKYYGVGGVDSTAFFNVYRGNYEIDIKAGGSYIERYTLFGAPKVLNGSWSFINTNSTYLQLQDSAETRVFLVLALENTGAKLKNPNADQQYWIKPKQ